MAIPPWQPIIPPEIQALMNQGNFREAYKRGAIEIGKQIIKKGPRMVEPITKMTQAGLRAAGMFSEAEGLGVATGGLTLSPEATALLASARLAAGWESIIAAGGTAMAAAEIVVPVLMVGLGIMFLMSLNMKPASAEPMKSKEYRLLNGKCQGALHRNPYAMPLGVVH